MTQSRISYYSMVKIVYGSFYLMAVLWPILLEFGLSPLFHPYQYMVPVPRMVQIVANIVFLTGGAVLIFAFLVRKERLRRKITAMAIEAHSNERKRISQELHEGLAQDVLTLKMQLSYLRACYIDVYGTSHTIRDEIQAIIDRLELIAWEMSPPSLEALGLLPAIRELTDRLRVSGELRPIDFQLIIHDALKIETCLSTNVKMFVFLALRELLSNIYNHSAASMCGISAAADGRSIKFEIWDNGQGFNPSKTSPGVGIASVRQGMEVLGGSVSFSSQIGNGTTVSLSVPFTEMSFKAAA